MPLLKTSGFLVSTVGKMHVTSSSATKLHIYCASLKVQERNVRSYIPYVTLSLGLIRSRQHATHNQIIVVL